MSKKVHRFVYDCPAAILCGVLQALLFGIFLILERYFPHVSKELFFLRYPELFRFYLGTTLTIFALLSFYKPMIFGLITTYLICSVRIIDSIQVHGYIRMTVWLIIMFCATWGLVRKYAVHNTYQKEVETNHGSVDTVWAEPSIPEE